MALKMNNITVLANDAVVLPFFARLTQWQDRRPVLSTEVEHFGY